MQWKLSEEQEAYRLALRGWLGAVAPTDQVRAWSEGEDGRGDPAPFEQRLIADGMSGVGIGEELGGQGGGGVELALTAEELARAAAPSSAWLATVLAAPALRCRPDLVEAGVAGHPLALVVTADQVPGVRGSAVRRGTDGRLTGRVPRVLGADRAAQLVVVVATDEGPRLHVVAAGGVGVSVTPRRLLDRSRSVADVDLTDVESEELDTDAAAVLDRVADLGAVLVAADALGAMQRMLDLAVEYSLQRHQFGVPIGSFQAVKHAAASILVDVEAGRSAVYYAAASSATDDPQRGLHAAAVKAQVTAAAARAADTALTMHGAIGYTWEHDLHLFAKRARLDRYLWGSPHAWNERLAGRLLVT